ncbi:NAD-dependent DNA ligase LigA [Metamycoplasma orale]|uniref:DNA ligase n=1 Tax=Metamycoplasma orale TaxID=2121 RepID=A0A448ZV60_METOS|nr:NAD-dependent DNA ligase LigA [Metamycoplasma orale]VEU55124.1 NAD(+)-dependent DNA ligase [Metamycoplasma orale]VEU56684.1 NAD(+)-dependent DNA ligase [Metamycoplasma orale]
MNAKEKNIREEILNLQKKIAEWDNAYYNLDNPIVTDEIYDTEFIRLQKLEKQYSYLLTYEEVKNSPTQKIDAKSLSIFDKVIHKKPMLSLNKAYSIEEIKKFIKNIEKYTNDFSFLIEPKIDGLSISLTYENGKLIRGVTRGDGITGEDVTKNILQINDIPKEIEYKHKIELRGEIYLSISRFNELNEENLKNNLPPLANPRNAAAGTLRQLDSNIVSQRGLSSFIYFVVDAPSHNIFTMEDAFCFLKKNNFHVVKDYKLAKNINQIEEYINNFPELKKTFDFEADGVVIKLNEIKWWNKIGQTQKFPHYAIAFKFEPNIEITTIKKIFITIGRTGLVTYNGQVKTVEISGSKINFATLNNFNYIKELNLNVGDEVYIKKAGEIIPCIIGLVNPKGKPDYFKRIETCPYCNSKLIESETFLEEYCENYNCPEIIKKQLIHFSSKECMNFFSMGEKIVEKLYENKLILNPLDFYNLKNNKNELTQLEKLGTKSIMKILNSIEDSKKLGLDKFIFALSIKHIGQKVASFIASKVQKLSEFLKFDFDSLIQYNEIGPKIIDSVKKWLSVDNNKKLINDFLNSGMNFEHISNIKSKLLDGINIVITGTLSKPRNYFEELIKANNGNIVNSVSKKTSYVLCGENPGSKLDKANELNVKVISENDLIDMLKNKN